MKFDKNKYSVVAERGYLLLIDEKGKEVPMQLGISVDSPADGLAVAKLEVFVNVVSSKEEAIKLYQENDNAKPSR